MSRIDPNYKLLNDVSRCLHELCPNAVICARYLCRNTGGEWTPVSNKVCTTDEYECFISVVKKE